MQDDPEPIAEPTEGTALPPAKRLNVGVVGASGYTGIELIKCLSRHPHVRLTRVTARQWVGQALHQVLPALGCDAILDGDLTFSRPDTADLAQCDLVFFATPHGVAMSQVPELLQSGTQVIDLSADFRLKDARLWQQWYHTSHQAPQALEEAVYGLSEWCPEKIAGARLVANPGCYPTSIQLPLLPLLASNLIQPNPIVADAKSGVSGAGRKAEMGLLAAEVSGDFKAYAASGHRHWPEIMQGLQAVVGSCDQPTVGLTFVPHLLPIVRGIEASLYVVPKPGVDVSHIHQHLSAFYAEAAFVEVLPSGQLPQMKWVSGTNRCMMGVSDPQGGGMLLISSVIDNLMKGAAGQAVQNMNIMMGWPQTTGLTRAPNWP